MLAEEHVDEFLHLILLTLAVPAELELPDHYAPRILLVVLGEAVDKLAREEATAPFDEVRVGRRRPYNDADVAQLSAEFAQVILQVIAIAQRKYYSKIAALESKVSELRSSNQALELELAQVKSRVLAADRRASPVAEGASTLSSTDPPSLQRSSDSIDQADQVSAADTDKDGIITVEILQTMGFDWPRKRMEMLLGALDEDGDGKVGLAEFVKLPSSSLPRTAREGGSITRWPCRRQRSITRWPCRRRFRRGSPSA